MNQVFVCGTYFMVYVSILKTICQKDKHVKNLLILNDHTPGIELLIPVLRENGFFDHCIFVPFRQIEARLKKETGFIGKIFRRNRNVIDYVERHSAIALHSEFIKASEFNLFYLWGLPSAYFIVKHPRNLARIIEDGTRNYILKTSLFKFLKRKYLLNTFIGDGFDASVKEVHVQYPEDLDPRMKHKGVKLELKKMQAGLSKSDQARILAVFMRDFQIDLVATKRIMIATQPISEDGFVTEEYKIRLFTDIIREYGAGYQVYLKPHPRELTNYREKLHMDFIEIPRSFPLEMFELMNNVSFDRGVTLFSSAFKNLTCITEKIKLGKEYVRELLPGKKLYVN